MLYGSKMKDKIDEKLKELNNMVNDGNILARCPNCQCFLETIFVKKCINCNCKININEITLMMVNFSN